MRLRSIVPVLLLGLVLAVVGPASAQDPASEEAFFGSESSDTLRRLPLDDLEAFEEAGANWTIEGEVGSLDWTDAELTVRPGTGVLVNRPTEEARSNLVTRLTHGDLHLRFEVLVPEGSNSGVYLQGRYEIQILDSWGVRRPTYGDMGGLYHRWDPARPEGERGYQGHAPRIDATRAPGLWQEVEVVFRAPRFDEDGEKVARARIDRLLLNGVVIHRELALTGPTRGGMEGEVARGPLLIQGDHGPVAVRDVRYRVPREAESGSPPADLPDPIYEEPDGAVLVQRGFAFHGEDKRVHAASVGHPGGPHVTVDLETGAPLRLWRGPFVDASAMWRSRGRAQVARPRGSTVVLSGSPAFTGEEGGEAPRSLGYDLDPEGRPVFRYALSGAEVDDRWEPALDGRVLERRIAVRRSSDAASADGDVRHTVVESATIRELGDGRYVVGDRSLYVDLLAVEGAEVAIREAGAGRRLEVIWPASAEGLLRYRYVW